MVMVCGFIKVRVLFQGSSVQRRRNQIISSIQVNKHFIYRLLCMILCLDASYILKNISVVNQMNSVLRSLQLEKDRARRALEAESSLVTTHNPTAVISSLRVSLNQVTEEY